MSQRSTAVMFSRDGHLYVTFHDIAVAAGPFLNPAPDVSTSYLVVAPGVELGIRDRYDHGVRLPHRNLFAATAVGDSMIGLIRSGDICIFERSDEVRSGELTLVEKVGPDEGQGSWAIKTVVIERPRRVARDEFGEETDWNEPVIVLRSYNRSVKAWLLDPNSPYRARGKFLRVYNGPRVDRESVQD